MKKLLMFFILVLGAPNIANAVIASADTADGYSLKVLDKVINNYKLPNVEDKSNSTLVLVRITNEGRPYSCEIAKSSGNTLLDNSVCDAVAASLSFDSPPYGQPIDISLAFKFGDITTQTNTQNVIDTQKSYAELLIDNLKSKIVIPSSVQGQVQVSVRLKVSPEGNIVQLAIEKPSGNVEADNEVLRAILSPGVVFTPASKKEEDVIITLTLRNV